MAAGQGPIYDNTITFPTNKSDNNATPSVTTLTATEANAQGSFNYATRTAITGGIYHGVADQSASLPPVSPATGVTWTSSGGKLVASEKGAPYAWIRNVEYINIRDPRFGVVGNGIADDTVAVRAWVAALTNSFRTSTRRVGYVSPGQYRLTSPVTLADGSYGLHIVGEGPWASQFILDPAVAKGNGFRINSSINTTLANFGILCKASNPAGKVLFYDFNPVSLASAQHKLQDLLISSIDFRNTHDYSVFWSDLYGNNSEAIYDNCTFARYNQAGVALPGSQQYGHRFSGCGIQGAWDQVTPGVNGGLYGIWAGPSIGTPYWTASTVYAAGAIVAGTVIGSANYYTCVTGGTSASSGGPSGTGASITDGSVTWSYLRGSAKGSGCFSVRNSNVGGNALADFRIETPTQEPVIIDGLDSEGSYQTVGTGSAPVATNTASGLTLMRSRINYVAGKYDAAGTINWPFPGTVNIQDNYIFSNATSSPPLIRFALGTAPRGITIHGNNFATLNSVATDPVSVVGTAVNYRNCIDVRNNAFASAGGLVAYRDEAINIPAPTAALGVGNMGTSFESTRCERLLSVDLTQFNANALTQTVSLATAMPQSITYLDARVLLYNYLAITGGAAVSVKIGTSSGGDQLLQSTVLGTSSSGDNAVWYGESSAQRGSAMLSSGGHMPDGANPTVIYVTLTAATGTLGNGTTSNITRGLLHLALEYKIQPRFIY